MERRDPLREGLTEQCEWRVEVKDGWDAFATATAKKLPSDYVCSTRPNEMTCVRRLAGDAFFLTLEGERRSDRLLVLARLSASPD